MENLQKNRSIEEYLKDFFEVILFETKKGYYYPYSNDLFVLTIAPYELKDKDKYKVETMFTIKETPKTPMPIPKEIELSVSPLFPKVNEPKTLTLKKLKAYLEDVYYGYILLEKDKYSMNFSKTNGEIYKAYKRGKKGKKLIEKVLAENKEIEIILAKKECVKIYWDSSNKCLFLLSRGMIREERPLLLKIEIGLKNEARTYIFPNKYFYRSIALFDKPPIEECEIKEVHPITEDDIEELSAEELRNLIQALTSDLLPEEKERIKDEIDELNSILLNKNIS